MSTSEQKYFKDGIKIHSGSLICQDYMIINFVYSVYILCYCYNQVLWHKLLYLNHMINDNLLISWPFNTSTPMRY